MKTVILSLLVFFNTTLASFNRNEAHLKWKTAETEHFRLFFTPDLQPIAEYVAGLAEELYSEKSKRFSLKFKSKIALVLRDEVNPNGFANPYQTHMEIWISDWEMIPLRSTHNWLKDVVAHEFSHLVSIRTGSKLPTEFAGVIIGYQDYFNEDIQSSFTSIYPFTSQPHWFAEGVAQYESEISGFDKWDSHRDMLLRIAVLEDSLMSFDRMAVFAGKGLHWEQGPYTQGFGFVRFLAKRFGEQAVNKLWSELSRMHRQTMSAALKRVLGYSGQELWNMWRSELKQKYQEQMEKAGRQVYGKKLTKHSFFNFYPKWNSKDDAIFFISNQGSNWFRSRLMSYRLNDTIPEAKRQVTVSGALRGYFDIMPDDSTFLFASGRNKNKYGEMVLDIYQQKLVKKRNRIPFKKDETEKRFTKELNAWQANYSPGHKRIAFVKNELSNFFLCIANLPGKGQLIDEDIKVLFPPDSMVENKFGFNVYTPKISPDGKRILFSYYDGESRKIGLINSDGTGFEPIIDRFSDDRDPEWHPSGNSFLFASDSTGIFNLYSYSLVKKEIKAVTNVAGGAFLPSYSSDGGKVAYINFDKDGYSLYLLDTLLLLEEKHKFHQAEGHEPLSWEPMEFGSASEKYMAIPRRFIYQPLLIGQELSALDKEAMKGETKWLAGISIFGNDPIYKNDISAALLLEIGKGLNYIGFYDDLLNPDKESELFLNYWNHSLPVSIGAGFSRTNITTFDTTVIQSANIDDEDSNTVQNHAITLKNTQLSLKYNLFDTKIYEDPLKASFISVSAGKTWNEFNFYEMPFSFKFYDNVFLSAAFWYYGVRPSAKMDIAPKGMAAFANYGLSYSKLFRGGSFRETFLFEDGVIKPVFKDYTLHEIDAGLDYGFSIPWSKTSSLRASANMGSILSWKQTSKKDRADTLNSYFERGIFLRAYPYLLNTEELLFRGTNTMQFSLELNHSLISNIYKTFWIFFVEDVYANLFWESGRAWHGKLKDIELAKAEFWDEAKRDDIWFQSVGWGLKLNTRIYHNFPFFIFFEAATALNKVPVYKKDTDASPDSKERGERTLMQLDKLDLFGINTYATRLRFGVTLGFYNGLLGKGQRPGRPGTRALKRR